MHERLHCVVLVCRITIGHGFGKRQVTTYCSLLSVCGKRISRSVIAVATADHSSIPNDVKLKEFLCLVNHLL